jgi:hypothetical protein
MIFPGSTGLSLYVRQDTLMLIVSMIDIIFTSPPALFRRDVRNVEHAPE